MQDFSITGRTTFYEAVIFYAFSAGVVWEIPKNLIYLTPELPPKELARYVKGGRNFLQPLIIADQFSMLKQPLHTRTGMNYGDM